MHPAVRSGVVLTRVLFVAVFDRTVAGRGQNRIILGFKGRPGSVQVADMPVFVVLLIFTHGPFAQRAALVELIVRKKLRQCPPLFNARFIVRRLNGLFNFFRHTKAVFCRRDVHRGIGGDGGMIVSGLVLRRIRRNDEIFFPFFERRFSRLITSVAGFVGEIFRRGELLPEVCLLRQQRQEDILFQIQPSTVIFDLRIAIALPVFENRQQHPACARVPVLERIPAVIFHHHCAVAVCVHRHLDRVRHAIGL